MANIPFLNNAYFAGKVGIGTASPSELLHLFSASGGTMFVLEGNNPEILLDDNNGDNVYIRNTGGDLAFKKTDGSSVNMTIEQGGNVGIGTTSPGQKLDVAGNMRLQNQLYDSTNSQGSSGQVLSKVSAGTQWASVSSLYTETDTLDSVTDRGATTTNDINIGNLEVNSDISTPNNTSLRLQPSGSSGWIFLGSPTDGTKIYHYSRGDNGQNTVYDFDAGYYKINTTATSGFNLTQDTKVSGDLTVTGKVTAQEFHTTFVSASIMYESGSTKFGDTSDDIHSFSGSLRVTGSGDHYFTDGNVGIGTTSPGYNLVVGDGTTDTESRFYHSDASYTSVRGFGLYMSRTNSYIRPVNDGSQTLYIGTDSKTWGTLSADANIFTCLLYTSDAADE